MKIYEKKQKSDNSQTRRDDEYQSKLSSELNDAANGKAWDRVLAAIIRGANPNDQKVLHNGNNPVRIAIENQRNDILDALLRLGANPNSIVDSHSGLSPLDIAIRCFNKEAIDILVKSGADVNAKSANGFTPLVSACSLSIPGAENINDARTPAPPEWADLIKRLLEYGADPNISDNEGNVPLHYAIKYKYLEPVQLLLEHEADVSLENKHKISPMALARQNRDVKISRLLESASKDVIQR